MATYKEFASEDIKTTRAYLNQLVDILQEDISGSNTRRKYQIYVTGGVGPGITSSQYQTVYDQDFTLQTANPIMDFSLGLFSGSAVVTGSNPTIDSDGKYIFPSQSVMMREKMDMYRQMAGSLLGTSNGQFSFISGSTTQTINEALFVGFRRLFARDQIKRETFAIQLYQTASSVADNLEVQAISASIYTDLSSSVNKDLSFGGQVSAIVNSANVNQQVGLLYIDRGIAVLDVARIFDPGTSGTVGASFALTGTLSGMSTGGTVPFTGSLNQFLASGSVDNILDHIATTRFSGSAQTAMTFQNITNINSTLYFCRMAADEFNYSSNPTFTDINNRIVVIDPGQEESQRTFAFITSVGLYDANDNLLGVGKLSRPVLKDDERDLTLKLRLDF
jgi:hypothetical protein